MNLMPAAYRLILILSLLLLLIYSCKTTEKQISIEAIGDLSRFNTAASLILTEYVDPVSARSLINWSRRGIITEIGNSSASDTGKDRLWHGNIPSRYQQTSANGITDIRRNFKRLITSTTEAYQTISVSRLVDAALKEVVSHLDRYCRLFTPDTLAKLETETKGQTSGIGALIAMDNGYVTVVWPIEGSPTARSGILAGDRILQIDGEKVSGLKDAATKFRGPAGSKLTLKLLRKNDVNPTDLDLVREPVPTKSVHAMMLQPEYGYVWVGGFDENTLDDIRKGIAAIDIAEAPLKGVILDLRDNPGGLLSQAVALSDLFLDAGLIVTVKGRVNRNTQIFRARPEAIRDSLPIIVLINSGSASGAEIVAGALQQNRRAVVLGQTSIGKGSIQAIEAIGDGYGLKMTIARYFTPNGRPIEGHGIVPDVVLEGDLAEGERIITFNPQRLVYDDAVNLALAVLHKSPSARYRDLHTAAKQIAKKEGYLKGRGDNASSPQKRSFRYRFLTI